VKRSKIFRKIRDVPTVVSQAWHSWKNAKAVALFASLALAIGIGSATAIYTVVRSVMLAPLPYANGDRFVALYGARFSEPGQYSAHAWPDLVEYERRTTSFDVFGWFRLGAFNLTFQGEPQHVSGAAVTSSLARGVGVSPIIGQWFTDDTGVVISNTLWRRLGGSRNIVGAGITLDGRRLTITGVMPPRFRLPLPGPGPGAGNINSDVWFALDPSGRGQGREGLNFAYARRKPGITLAQADADAKRAAAEIAKLDPASHPSYTARVDDLRETGISTIRPTMLLLFAAAGLLLLITCANVAGLLIARSVSRARETATRVALGASARQLALQYFVESVFVSLAGAVAGIFASVGLVRVVVSLAADFIPRVDEIGVDWTVFVFALGAAFFASAISSLAPLWQAVRTAPNDVLGDGARASAGARVRKLSQSLVVAEIALAFTLLAVSAQLIAHLRTLAGTSPGFDPNQLLTFDLTMAESMASPEETRLPYQKRLTDALAAIPGVVSVAIANQLPLDGCCMAGTIHPEGRALNPEAVERTIILIVSPDYLRTMRIPLRAGRFLTEADTSKDVIYAVVNQTAVARYWPDQNPLGAFGRFNRPDGDRFQIVGVVGDVRHNGLGKPTDSEIYLLNSVAAANPFSFVIRSPLPPDRLLPEVRRAVRSIDPTLAIHDVATMSHIVSDSMRLERLGSFMMTFFASAALLMASLGVYGLISYAVRQRRVEIGTRMALGAVSRDVQALIVGSGLKTAAYGIAAGAVAFTAGAWFLTRYFDTLNPGWLPLVFATAVAAATAVLASSIPAWRAARLSPMVAIRDEPQSLWISARQSIRRAVKHISQVVAAVDESQRLTEGGLLADLVTAVRRADSFPEALRTALATLCRTLDARTAVLLEKYSGGRYQYTASVPEQAGQLNCSLPADGFLLNRLRAYEAPLPVRTADLETLARWAGGRFPERLPEIETLKQIDVRIAVALRSKREISAVLLLGPPAGRDDYTDAERRLLRACSAPLALMIENGRLTDRVVEQEKLRRDLALAAEVQRRLLPAEPPDAGVASLAAISLPARSVGGDYYDFVEVGDHQIGLALADVAGKGVAAALIMSVVQASLRILSSEGDISLPQLAAKMNQFLHRSTASNSYATFFYAQLDKNSRRLRYVNAGHLPPYLLRSNDGCLQELSAGGAVIGLFPEMHYEEGAVDLQAGDVLIAFTDGVTEALNANDEEFGEERLRDLLRQVVHLPVREISLSISEALKCWIKDAPQYDDLTFVVMKVDRQ
jgi:predicted permease